jgi:sugar lactone lactonase YvrE
MDTQPRRYAPVATLAGRGTAGEFKKSLSGVAVGAGRAIHALGDGEIRVFDANGGVIRTWKAPEQAACLTVAQDGRVLAGAPGRIEIYGAAGNRVGGFAVGQAGQPADVTAVKVFRDMILVADASARLVRRFDTNGAERGLIGSQHKTGSFMLPNRSLDIDVDAAGTVYATDTGRHQVTTWKLDGAAVAAFGKFGQASPEDFVGCCNPVNLAVAPDGCVVTSEKVAARVKVFGPDRALIAVIGPEHFDSMCTHIHLAVDSSGRIVAADPVRRTITIFGQS